MPPLRVHQKERQAQQMPPQKVAQKPEPLLMQPLRVVQKVVQMPLPQKERQVL